MTPLAHNSSSRKKWMIGSATAVLLIGGGGYLFKSSTVEKAAGPGAPSAERVPPAGSEGSLRSNHRDHSAAPVGEGARNLTSNSPVTPTTTSASDQDAPATEAAAKKSATSVLPSLAGAPPVPGQPGGPITNADSAHPAAQPITPPVPVVVAPSCFQLSYRHKKLAAHADDDTCSRHKNLVQLPREDVNLAAVCVKVGKYPAAFRSVKGKSNQLLLDSIAGPDTVIQVSYCVGKEKNPLSGTSECLVPQKDQGRAAKPDGFLAAIGGDADEAVAAETKTAKKAKGKSPLLGQWDPAAKAVGDDDAEAQVGEELGRELASVDEEAEAGAHAHGSLGASGAVFEGWIGGEEKALPTVRAASR